MLIRSISYRTITSGNRYIRQAVISTGKKLKIPQCSSCSRYKHGCKLSWCVIRNMKRHVCGCDERLCRNVQWHRFILNQTSWVQRLQVSVHCLHAADVAASSVISLCVCFSGDTPPTHTPLYRHTHLLLMASFLTNQYSAVELLGLLILAACVCVCLLSISSPLPVQK